jgi:hypothetical protein
MEAEAVFVVAFAGEVVVDTAIRTASFILEMA